MELRFILGLCAVFSAGACTKATDANSVADRFIDAYYLEFNFDGALKMTAGSATRRIEAERKLASESRASGALAGARAKVYYETPEHLEVDVSNNVPPLGIGDGAIIEKAIIDKNVRIGRQANVINDRGLTDLPESQYFTIRDGVIVVPKNAVLGDGWRPALGSN